MNCCNPLNPFDPRTAMMMQAIANANQRRCNCQRDNDQSYDELYEALKNPKAALAVLGFVVAVAISPFVFCAFLVCVLHLVTGT